MKKLWLSHRALCIFLAVVLIFAIVVGALLYHEYGAIWKGEFTPEAWRDHPALRYKMIADMEQKIDIWHRTPKKVYDILGPDSFGINEDPDLGGKTLFKYYIKPNILFFPEYYFVIFDSSGRVTDIFTDSD